MLSMTEFDTPKFSLAKPEEFKEASQKVMNFWVGALSPMWVPFWAASSFGIGAWALSQSFNKVEGLSGDIAAPVKLWPTMDLLWGRSAGAIDTVEAVVEKAMKEQTRIALDIEHAVVAETYGLATKTAAAADTAADEASEIMEDNSHAATQVVEDDTANVVQATEQATDETNAVADTVENAASEAEATVAEAVTPEPVASEAQVAAQDYLPEAVQQLDLEPTATSTDPLAPKPIGLSATKKSRKP